MAPSQKRKRKPLPKRPCPCCGSILSEKTIERHASGTHVPTRINVILAVAALEQANLSSDVSASGDPSRHSSGNAPDLDDAWDRESDPDPMTRNPADHPHESDPDAMNPTDHPHDACDDDGEPRSNTEIEARGIALEKFIQKTWSGWQSDTEDEDYEENRRNLDSDLDDESDFEWEGEGL